MLRFLKVEENAINPTFDVVNKYRLYSPKNMVLKANETHVLKIGLKIAFPENYCALVSYIDDPHGFQGVVDSDYRGELCVIATPKEDKVIKRADPIAKIVVLEIETPEIKCVDEEISDEINEILS